MNPWFAPPNHPNNGKAAVAGDLAKEGVAKPWGTLNHLWRTQQGMATDAKELRPAPGLGDDGYSLLDDLEILSNQRQSIPT
jgi:hypothetical protein